MKKKKRQKRIRYFIFFTFLFVIFFNARNHTNSETIPLHSLNSSHAILIDIQSDAKIAEYNSKDIIYPASLTKIMTALIAIEEIPDLNQTITLSQEMFQHLYQENASMAGFLPNETVSVKDLLYGILLPSGAECCIQIAEYITGSEENFVKLMNQKAKALNMNDTNFTNCTGLHNENHYSTVKDISLLLKQALKNDTFRTVFTSRFYSVPPTNMHSEGFTFHSTLFKNLSSADFEKGSILGGKTGYTSKAGYCLASLASINQKEYILVTAKATATNEEMFPHIADALTVYQSIKN